MGGWIKARHEPLIERALFDVVQEIRTKGHSPRQTINAGARIYSLSGIARCARCNGNIRMQTSHKGRPRVYCASRAEGLGCDFGGTFLDIYENQIEWYLDNFVIPDDYQQEILDAHKRLTKTYDDTQKQREQLKANLERLKKQYRWGHLSEREYLTEFQETETQLRQLSPLQHQEGGLKRLAQFLGNVAAAWREATQEQRNKLARVLFEEIRLDTGGKVLSQANG